MRRIISRVLFLTCIGASAATHAEGFGTSILQISNFRLLDASGQPYRTATAHVIYEAGVGMIEGSTSGGNSNMSSSAIDMPRLYLNCISGDCSMPENDFSPWTPPPPEPHLVRADQLMTGALDDTGTQPVSMYGRGDSVLGSVNVTGAWGGGGGGRATMTFMPLVSGPMTFVFDANSSVSLRLDPAPGENNAFGHTDLHILIVRVDTQGTVFSSMPDPLNPSLELHQPGSLSHDTGWQTYTLTTGPLDSNITYSLLVNYGTGALFNHIVAIPEPAPVVMLAAGLAVLAFSLRSRTIAPL